MGTGDGLEHRVLLGTAGTGTTWGVLASLRDAFPKAYTVAADMAPAHLIAAAAVADAFEQVPPIAEEDEFVPALLEIIDRHGIETYVPTHDPEVVLAAELREAGRLSGVLCTAPPSWSGRLCWDKLDLAAWLAEHQFPTPATRPASEIDEVAHDWIVKPRRGVGSVGAERITSLADLERLRERGTDGAIAQPLLSGPELTVDAFLGDDGAGAAICRERLEVKSGVSTKARIFHDEEIETLVLSVGRALELRGAFCIQVMKDAAGTWSITDVNPRPGAGTRLSVAVGFNVHAAMFSDLWGEDPTPYLSRVDGERWAVRQYREIVLV